MRNTHDHKERTPGNMPGEAQDPLVRLTQNADPSWHIGARLRNYFITGLVVVGPVTITLYIGWTFIKWVDAWVKPWLPRIYNPDTYLPIEIPGVGLIFAILGLMMIGALTANLIGRALISSGELMLGRMPIVRNVYGLLKQVFESVVQTGNGARFQKVGLIEFPSAGIWSIVFLTAEATTEIKAKLPGVPDLITVFMPTGIMPPTGFVCFVPRATVILVDMTVEDAAKIVVSAGMAGPDQARLKRLAEEARTVAAPAPRPRGT
jgi:uncharacterized membrane protein